MKTSKEIAKVEDIKIRVPAAIKAAIKQIAAKRFTSESEIAREALIEYLKRRGALPEEQKGGKAAA